MAEERLFSYDRIAVEEAASQLRSGLRRRASPLEISQLLSALADLVLAPAIPSSSCQKGCSHCCKQSSIVIDEADAIVLSLATNRPIADISKSQVSDWKGVACTFLNLEDGSCTAYAYRPLTCRLSISIDLPEKCFTEEERQMVVLPAVYSDLCKLVGDEDRNAFFASRGAGRSGDIRAFFPPKV